MMCRHFASIVTFVMRPNYHIMCQCGWVKESGEGASYSGRENFKDVFSDEFYVVFWSLAMSGGPRVIRKVTGSNTALRVIGSELKLCEEKQ